LVTLFVQEVRRRPPDQLSAPPLAADPEIELHRPESEFVLGASSFGITDSLTMLYSHRHFHETARGQAQRAGLQNRPFAVVPAQLDEIAEINRSSGFAQGDSALRSVALTVQQAAAVALTVQQAAARCEGLAFRASGRRIALLCPGMDQAEAERTAVALEESAPRRAADPPRSRRMAARRGRRAGDQPGRSAPSRHRSRPFPSPLAADLTRFIGRLVEGPRRSSKQR